jgi:excisionase family DNA binding protein
MSQSSTSAKASKPRRSTKSNRALPDSKPQLFTKDELCDLVPCSPKFIEAEVAKGKLQAHKLSNKMIRFSADDVSKWLASKKV